MTQERASKSQAKQQKAQKDGANKANQNQVKLSEKKGEARTGGALAVCPARRIDGRW
jgi:hypothetical protein